MGREGIAVDTTDFVITLGWSLVQFFVFLWAFHGWPRTKGTKAPESLRVVP